MFVEVRVELKSGVLDPQAKTILQALKALGFSDVKSLRQTRSFILEFDHDDEQKALFEADKMASDLLANTVIEDYSVKIGEK